MLGSPRSLRACFTGGAAAGVVVGASEPERLFVDVCEGGLSI